MPPFPTAIHKSILLLVEGKEDALFFEALARFMELTEIQIHEVGGKDQFKTNLSALVLTSGYSDVRSIGIVRDGDANPTGAFQSVCSILRGLNLPIPKRPFHSAGDNPRISIFIMPDGTHSGMLEDLCLAAVANDVATPCVDAYFDCLQTAGIALRANVLAKAKIHTFLASREEPDQLLGRAAQKGYFPWEHSTVDHIKDFLRQISAI